MPAAEDKVIPDTSPQSDSAQAVATAAAPATPGQAQVKDKRVLPEGVVPKQAQAYVIAGLTLLILMAVLFSKNHARTAPKANTPVSAAVANNANQQQIHELEQNLSADQQQGERQQQKNQTQLQNRLQMQTSAQEPRAAAADTTGYGDAVTSSAVSGAETPPSSPRNTILNAEKVLAFKARFASNLVTPTSQADTTHAKAAGNSADGVSQFGSTQPSQLQRASAVQPATTSSARQPKEVNIDAAHGRPYVIFEGTMIDTVLTNRLDSNFAGPVKVMVTNPVYGRDGQHILIPAGTFILGHTQKVGSMGQTRLSVVFHRMIMPDGYSVDLDQFHGLDQIGDTGLKDKVNNHYLRIFGASIALGLVAGAAEATTYGGYTESGSDMYRQGVASSLSQSSGNVLDRFINIPPTITIREGHRIKIYLTQDLLLPAYEDHNMPGVM
jgi:type IV secretion system protein VirB10